MAIELLTEHELAELLGCSLSKLRRWRASGEGPAYVKIGSHVRYGREVVEAWLVSCTMGCVS